jgi:hypothetical protein
MNKSEKENQSERFTSMSIMGKKNWSSWLKECKQFLGSSPMQIDLIIPNIKMPLVYGIKILQIMHSKI